MGCAFAQALEIRIVRTGGRGDGTSGRRDRWGSPDRWPPRGTRCGPGRRKRRRRAESLRRISSDDRISDVKTIGQSGEAPKSVPARPAAAGRAENGGGPPAPCASGPPDAAREG
ncbi:hypothetical protein GCM10009605_20720 [Nocardiopsis composta]